jgi:SAM-dependent methyltransferase
MMDDPRFDRWLEELQARHLADYQISEITPALRALSAGYVERRGRLADRGGLDSAGKRAAYALYYNPLHFITVRLIADALGAAPGTISTILDLGCGAGAAGAAWGSRLHASTIIGVDSHPWAVREATLACRTFGLEPRMHRAHAARFPIPRSADAIVAGWLINELDDASRASLREKLLAAARAGQAVLIVEPIAGRVSPWWDDWATAFLAVRGRSDQWRFPVELPDLLRRLDRAAGLRHDELKARSLYVPAGRQVFR